MLDLINALQARWANIIVTKVYVDDLTLSVTGLPQKVIRVLAQAIDFAVHVMEDSMRMQVSAKKSKVVASKPSIALAIVNATVSVRTSTARLAKLLGTDAVGGARRSTIGFRKRLADFSRSVHRYNALRQLGVNTTLMTRTAGVPAFIYGCETMGLSDSCLNDARTKIAKAASPATSGRNPVLTLLALDGGSGTLDPAFEAHAAPIRHWANAVWDHWFDTQHMQSTLDAARRKLALAKGSWWNVVAGPTTALLTTVRRIGWRCVNATTLITDEGRDIDLLADPPAVVASEVREAVRRLRWKEADAILPGLLPTTDDVGMDHTRAQVTVIVPCIGTIGTLLRGKPCPKKAGSVRELWHAKYRGDLASAMCGGQWSQARKARVPAFDITDNRCQLCLGAVGTIEHRFNCPKTCPSEGWPAPPPQAAVATSKLSDQRLKHLALHGMLAIKVRVAPYVQHGTFQWLDQPSDDDPRLVDATWYCDGSLLDGKWKALRCAGFGIVVVSATGDLLGYGLGWPPSWCTTAAAAEAWALQFVVDYCPFVPAIRTDCQALVTTAASGTPSATHHTRPLARVWKRIAHSAGDDIADMVSCGKLVWVPAHKSHRAIGEAKKGDGQRLTAVDWRANRLVDLLAKAAAADRHGPRGVTDFLCSAEAAAAIAPGWLE
jgi:hypothetical protein